MEDCKENTARKERRKQVKKSQSPEKTIKFRVGRKQKVESGKQKAESGKWKAESRKQKL